MRLRGHMNGAHRHTRWYSSLGGLQSIWNADGAGRIAAAIWPSRAPASYNVIPGHKVVLEYVERVYSILCLCRPRKSSDQQQTHCY
jgi:hypothetical protein